MAKEASANGANEHLIAQLEGVISRLGLDQGPGLTRSWAQFTGNTNRHVVRQAFETVGTHAVFGFSAADLDGTQKFTPVLYLCVAQDDVAAKEIHRLVWSQGVVPLLLVATPPALQIRRSLGPPPEQPATILWDTIVDSERLPVELTSLTAVALRSSIVWRDFATDRRLRVDKALLECIVSLSHSVQGEQPNLDRQVIHAVIGRFLYFYVLLDRKIIDRVWIGNLKTQDGRPRCATIARSLGDPQGAYVVWPAREVWELFDAIDEVMNGAIFPVNSEERRKVTDRSLHLVHRVIRHGDRVGVEGRQLSFLDITFATLRTETVSAIYELFLALESEDTKSDDGAFYTPPFLVDYVLDEIDRIEPFTKLSRVLDPAAGSGIFLVGAYRRILERSLPTGSRTARHFHALRTLLEHNVFGIECNPQAANVCRFSLYLTLLDYMNGINISMLALMARGMRVFPPLTNNISSRDVFTVETEGVNSLGRFTHVVGNPPWGSFGDTASRTNAKRSKDRQQRIAHSRAAAVAYSETLDSRLFPVSNKRLSELFIWKIKNDLLAERGVLGVLISTKSFVSRSASAFPNTMSSQFTLVGIANLSHFRYRLFANARSPATAVFARNDEPHPMDEVWVYSPLLSSQPIGERGHLWTIIANAADVETHRLRDLVRSQDGWLDHLILRPLDRRYARHLKVWTERTSKSLGGFLDSAGMRISRGGSPLQTGLPERLLLKANYRKVLGLDGFGFPSYAHEELDRYQISAPYQRLFAGNVLLIPRTMNDFSFVERPIGFSSTFNAIHFREKRAGSAEATLLRAMARYLKSDVARYFYAIVGKSWILDHARLEKGDLEAVPFPIDGASDGAVLEILSGTNDQITQLFTDRMGFDSWFSEAVREYIDFRSGYEDSKLPFNSLRPPKQEEIVRYKRMLETQLIQVFGSKAEPVVQLQDERRSHYFGHLSIRLGRRGGGATQETVPVVIPIEAFGAFSPYSTISYDPKANSVAIVKPWAHVAWTMEQAFADAHRISAAILE